LDANNSVLNRLISLPAIQGKDRSKHQEWCV
jgi:hypothetical protein